MNADMELRVAAVPEAWRAAGVLFATIFLATLFGIYSRPVGFLASIWPANAIMLGLMLRNPVMAQAPGWMAGFAGFMIGDLLTGAGLEKALILNIANIISISTAYAILTRLPAEISELRQPVSMLWIVLASLAGGFASGLLGGIAGIKYWGGDALSGIVYWTAGEFVTYIAFLPVILSAPPLVQIRKYWYRLDLIDRSDLVPAMMVVLTFIASLLIGGPGAVAFPVLALLWCGLTWSVFATAVLTLVFGVMALGVIASGMVPYLDGFPDKAALSSFRLGASAIALVPITLAIVMRSRNELTERLRYLASHDALTGVTNRAAFHEQASRRLAAADLSTAMLMIDLDHFKSVNDTWGHAAGDEVLRETARRVVRMLRPADLFARVGGEEFVVMINGVTLEQAQSVAERLLTVVSEQPVRVGDGSILIAVTTSIGLAVARPDGATSPDALMQQADHALYQAKHGGRNRVVTVGVSGK
ncbi:GGDEF domain-containing protein [Rhodobacter sp. 24-YEA-8]|uniref:GGDEF domain-containing protein n=1 Tax=Rhodobacter sp. 24-YEA-8 TaxID=1884310 RepID=UPI0008976AFB|nr:GGDEF domain-containing protein [Rhodobacter sp. 24-YEA-8]SEB51064.1 diguanylate cyclase (GGDEF) domain-containing protein [Rhodobacter sp. 24-YEA-8]